MAATQSSYFARCLHISHQPARTAKSCFKELRTYEPRLFLAGNASANQSVGEGHEFRILSLRPYYTPSNAVWADPVSALRCVPLSAYAVDGQPATCSKEHAVRWIWGIVRWRSGDCMRTRYRRRLFSSSLQKIWRTGNIHWPMNESARINHRPHASMLFKHKARLIVL